MVITIQTTAQEFNFENFRHINVQGISTMEIVPNQIKVKATLKERYVGKDKIELTRIENTFNGVVAKHGISQDNISLDELTSSLQSYKKRKRDVLATKYFFIDFIDLNAAAAFMTDLSNSDIGSTILSKSHSDIIALRKEVKKDALKAAMEKASYLLKTANATRGKILRLVEIPSDEHNRYEKYQNFINGSNSYIEPEGLIGIVKNGLAPIVLSFGMDVTFEIVD